MAAIVVGLLLTASSTVPALSSVTLPFLSSLAGAGSTGPGGGAAVATPAIALATVAANLSDPVFVTESPDATGRLFIVEKTGRILIEAKGTVRSTPFFDIHTSVTQGSEQGLLGLAFSPSFTTNRKLYVNYTNLKGNSVVSEYRTSSTNPNVVDKSTGRVILTVAQPYSNHNGGNLAFGKDGYLYIGFGDGGSGGDPGNRAQSLTTLLGKMLRIDVSGTTATTNYKIPPSNPFVGKAGLDEIWEYGLRNPWRYSFDRSTGDLWIGDVGQNTYEEVDHGTTKSNGPGRGLNWGWHVMEGLHCYDPATGCNTTGKALPLTDYAHSGGRCAVTGGYVYRGSAIPSLVGTYVFGDYCSGEIMALDIASARPAAITVLKSTGFPISSFGQDKAGELYVCDLGGVVYKIVAA
ncbi:MAG TPA: PQQ-dependent sugar dehydrogenase [Candidatus Limnocylindrales bacterium]|jgi:glucose/arabinose dehydrogenase